MGSSMPYASYFDDNVFINRDNWAVTMICNSESSGQQVSFFGNNHAMLVVESIKKSGELFRQIIHLTGPASVQQPNEVMFLGSYCYVGMLRIGKVLLSSKNITNVSYTHKSETWLRSAEKVRIMRRDAKKERDHPSEFPRPFSIFGNRSVFTSHLETFKITDPLVNALANSDKKLFLRLYDRTQKCRDGLSPGIERLKEPYFNPLIDPYPYSYRSHGDGGYNIVQSVAWHVWDQGGINENQNLIDRVLLKQNFCWRSHISDKRFSEIADLFKKTISSEEREQLIQDAPENEKRFFITVRDRFEKSIKSYNDYIRGYFNKAAQKILRKYPQLEDRVHNLQSYCEEDAISTCNQLLMTIYEHSDLCRMKPDSCFTWACEKLKLIDVEIANKGIEFIISPTKMYLSPVNKYQKMAISKEPYIGLKDFYTEEEARKILTFGPKAQEMIDAAITGEVIAGSLLGIYSLIVVTLPTTIEAFRYLYGDVKSRKSKKFELLALDDDRFQFFVHLSNREKEADAEFEKNRKFFLALTQTQTFMSDLKECLICCDNYSNSMDNNNADERRFWRYVHFLKKKELIYKDFLKSLPMPHYYETDNSSDFEPWNSD